MPRFPVRKVYRAFRELDPFTDEQCERYVALTRRDLGCVYLIVPPLTTIVLFPACMYLVMLLRQHVWSVSPSACP